MGDALRKKQFYSVEEYEQIVRVAKPGERFEYAEGQIIVMDEYTSNAHATVVSNASFLLQSHFRPNGCRVYTENARLVIEGFGSHRLPDVMVTCSERDKQSEDMNQDPILLVEVLSNNVFSDLGDKVREYKSIETLKAYMIVNPKKVWVRVYERAGNGDFLPEKDYTNLSDSILLPSSGLTLPLSSLYLDIF
jgi:Uma2 family endonuclease